MGEDHIIQKLRTLEAENRLLKREAIKGALQHMWDESEIKFLNGYVEWLGHVDPAKTKPRRTHQKK